MSETIGSAGTVGGTGVEMTDPLPGANVELPPEITAKVFDRAHGETASSELLWRLSAEAYGADYPTEVQPWGMTTWWTLGRWVSELRIGPGQQLVDLACGRGGPGLWVARAVGADLIGVDWSPVAIRESTARSTQFLPAGRARFQVGDLAATGLPDASADGVMCADAIFFATDRVAAFTEVARVLKPGARFVFTCDEDANAARPTAVPDWTPLVEAGGLVVETKEVIPRFVESVQRMYDLWLANIDALRAELGDLSADDLVDEAERVGPTLASRTALLITTHAA
jgi:ubiquinone/menaquinone biosynthesis C-methylase UbiE